MKEYRNILVVLMLVGMFSCKDTKEQREPGSNNLENTIVETPQSVENDVDTITSSDVKEIDNFKSTDGINAPTPAPAGKSNTNTAKGKANMQDEKTVLPPPPPNVASPKVVIAGDTPAPPQKVNNENPDHSAFNKILQTYVSADGKVNYTGLKKNRAALDSYLDELSAAGNIKKWSQKEQLAYWINLYNASTLQLVIDNFPVKSIKDVASGKPWDSYFIKVGAVTYTLNEIENNIIRKQFSEPRIHFAVNCAAKSCPPLSNKAYTADNMEKMLDTNAKSFINGNQNDIKANSIAISNVFKWYAVDFGDIADYINKYSSTKTGNNPKVTYKEYDWSLNGY